MAEYRERTTRADEAAFEEHAADDLQAAPVIPA
jgi:hypothetical protein